MTIKKYNIVFTDIAQNDLFEIYDYIYNNLKESHIAKKLMKKIDLEINRLSYFPYSCAEIPIKLSKLKYRRLVIKNYIVLYRIIENKNEVVIFRVLYSKKDYMQIF